MANNERKSGESNKQYLNRIKAQKKEQRIQEEINRVKSQEDYGGELEPAVLMVEQNPATISQGYQTVSRRNNDHRVGQKSVFGEREYNAHPSLAQRLGNWITDGLHLTSPPTMQGGYGRTLNAEVPTWESAQGQELKRMGETAKDAGNLALTGLAFGNPLTASNAMAPLIAGSQAYWIGHGINDGTQRIENIGEGVKNFVEDPSWQNAGAVVKEVPMLALDVASALPVARTVIETGKNAIPAAQQAAQRIAGSVDDAITTATKRVVESGVVGVNELPAQLAARATSTPKVQEPLPNVGWAPSQTMNVRRAGELTEMYYPNRWDVVEEGANPFGVWLQGKFGTPRTNITNPGKGERAAKARELFANRPQYVGNVTFKKPIQVIGEVPNRSSLSYEAERMGADGIIYNGVYDNGYNNNQVIFSFNKPVLNNTSQKLLQIVSPEMRKILTHELDGKNFIKIVNGKWNKSIPNPSMMATNKDKWANLYGNVTLLGDESLLKDSYLFNGDGGTSTISWLGLDDIDDVQEVSRRMKYFDDTDSNIPPKISELDLRRQIKYGWLDTYAEVKRTVPTPISDFKHAFVYKSDLTPELQSALESSGIPFTIITRPKYYEIKDFISKNPQFEWKKGGKL